MKMERRDADTVRAPGQLGGSNWPLPTMDKEFHYGTTNSSSRSPRTSRRRAHHPAGTRS